MGSALLAVAAANALFVVACGTVSVRLLMLSRRTQQLPEFYLGAGFSCMVVSLPFMGLSGLGRATAGDVDLLLLAVGLLLFWLAVSTQAAFTWTAFRPRAAWAENLVLGIGATQAVLTGGALYALGAAPPDTPSFDAAFHWMQFLRVPIGVVYLWTSIESWLQYAMARRRNRIGLGDPVTTDRILLWAINSLLGVVTVVVSTLLHLDSRGPFADPRAAIALGVSGLIGAFVLYLAFMPPAWYLRRVHARS